MTKQKTEFVHTPLLVCMHFPLEFLHSSSFIHRNSIKHRGKCFVFVFVLSFVFLLLLLLFFAVFSIYVCVCENFQKSLKQNINCHLLTMNIETFKNCKYRYHSQNAYNVEQMTRMNRQRFTFSPTEFCVQKKTWIKNRSRRRATTTKIHFLSEVAHWLENI